MTSLKQRLIYGLECVQRSVFIRKIIFSGTSYNQCLIIKPLLLHRASL